MSFVCLEAGKLNDARRSAEDTIGANGIVDEFFGNAHAFVGLGFCDDAPLNFNLILTVWGRLTHQTLFKLFTRFHLARRRLTWNSCPGPFHASLIFILIKFARPGYARHSWIMLHLNFASLPTRS